MSCQKWLGTCGVLLFLAGCSGGGSSEPTQQSVSQPPPPPPFQSLVQQAYIKASNAEKADFFGSSIALFGDTLVVGAPSEASNETRIINGSTASSDNSAPLAGAVYVFTRSGGGWTQEAYLKAPNAETTDRFGESVAIWGNTIVVGAPGEASKETRITNGSTASSDNSAPGAGAVYVFTRNRSGWTQEAYLKASNADSSDTFGSSVAISGDTIVVGAPNEESNETRITNGSTASLDNSAPSAGAAYVFTRSSNSWSQEAYLKAPNAKAFHSFGDRVAIDGKTIVVGALLEGSSEPMIINGPTASTDNSALGTGAVYVFVLDNNGDWGQQAYLKASNAGANDRFGSSIAISGNTIVVGAPNEASNQAFITNGPTASADNLASKAGAAYVFTRSGTMWAQEAYLKASNVQADDLFGYSVAIRGNTIIVGAPDEDSNQKTVTNDASTASTDNSASNAGAVYVFTHSGSGWAQEAYLKASNAGDNDRFGRSIALNSTTIVVSAPIEASQEAIIINGSTASTDDSAPAAGAMYVFH